MFHKFKSVLISLLAGAAVAAHADFAEDLAKKFPATAGAKIEKSFPGFYSVSKGSEVVFVRDDMTIMINGDVIDLVGQRSITAALKDLNKPKLDVSSLNTQDAIRFGEGKNKLYIFSDPDCPYCRQLERDLIKLTDTQVFIFPFPLTSIHPNARVIAESIWCSSSRASAWRDYLLLGKKPDFKTCDNPISRNLALGETYQIQGTPALIFEDGSIVPGAIPLQQIEARIAAAQTSKK